MPNQDLTDLTPGTPPYDSATLFEVDVPGVGTRSAQLGQLVATLSLVTSIAELRSTYNGSGVIPASNATSGFAITSNYEGLGAVEFWNLVNSSVDAQGWAWWQKTGAGTAQMRSALYGDAVYVEHDWYGGGVWLASLYAD